MTPDAALIPLMPPEMLAEFIGDGHSINVATGEVLKWPGALARSGLGRNRAGDAAERPLLSRDW